MWKAAVVSTTLVVPNLVLKVPQMVWEAMKTVVKVTLHCIWVFLEIHHELSKTCPDKIKLSLSTAGSLSGLMNERACVKRAPSWSRGMRLLCALTRDQYITASETDVLSTEHLINMKECCSEDFPPPQTKVDHSQTPCL
ncbi:hypothetical protein AOLI_G00060730 [Acnodon oligacanthus]